MPEPAPATKAWTDSKTIRYLACSWVGGALLLLVPMLQAKQIDWWALGAQSIASLAAIIIRMGSDDIEAPVGFLNRKDD